eukprot:3428079-Pyramimonas_sp.AAC.1
MPPRAGDSEIQGGGPPPPRRDICVHLRHPEAHVVLCKGETRGGSSQRKNKIVRKFGQAKTPKAGLNMRDTDRESRCT